MKLDEFDSGAESHDDTQKKNPAFETGIFIYIATRGMAAAARPATPAAAIRECNPMHYPNIRVMLQLACTLPVTSCECERSASTMRRLHTYMRTSMTQERLSSLALLHIHYDVPIDLDEAVNIYSPAPPPRRLALDSLIKP